MKIQNKIGRVGEGGRGRVGCERRIEVFEKIHKKFGGCSGWGGLGCGGVRVAGGQGGCERRIGVFLKIQKGGGSGGGVGGQGRCDRRIEVFGKIHRGSG